VDHVSSDFHDAVWRVLPADALPIGFAERRAFLVENVAPGERVLDYGCGGGAFAAELESAGAEVIGVDVSAEALRRARAARPNLDLREIAPDKPLPFEDAEFDAVWAGDVLTHVLDLAAVLSELRRVVRPEGRLLVTARNHSRWSMLGIALSRRRFAAHFDPRSQHVRFFTMPTLRDLLCDMGFVDLELRATGSTLCARAVRPALGRAR
jgi:SAM-dependent methyltransferase